MKYEERVVPPLSWWLAGLGLVVSVAVAVFAYVELWLAILLVALAGVATVVALLGYTLRIRVGDDGLRVGRHLLEPEYIASVEAVEELPGMGEHDSFLILRPYCKQQVRVVLDDPADPHPAWFVSTRNGERLAEAIQGLVR